MGLSEKKKEAARHLVNGVSKTQAARFVGCDPSTLRRWLHQEEFIEYLERLKDGAVESDLKTFGLSKVDTYDRLEEMRHMTINRFLHLLSLPEEASRNEINLLRIAGKWCGLESINDRVDMQLEYLQRKMPPQAYDKLLKALATSSTAEITSPNAATQ